MLAAAPNVYEDLRLTEVFLRSHEDWVSRVFIKPAGLSVDVSRVHKLILDEEELYQLLRSLYRYDRGGWR